MNREQGALRSDHRRPRVEQADARVVYDPNRLSPGAIDRIIHTAAFLCAAVQGLDVAPGINQPTAAKVLQDPLLRMKRELAAVGFLPPADQVPN